REERLLLNSLDLSVEDGAAEIVRAGGVCIAAHVDRQAFGLLGVLGLIPPALSLVALEVSRREALPDLTGRLSNGDGYPLVFASDAHCLHDMGRSITMVNHNITNPTELIEALRGNAYERIKGMSQKE
ncbi:MAG: histidinol-phosphatase, partial [Clostridia bacterium]|nr:histidinol-phosphatase [Clostridia bacterium]